MRPTSAATFGLAALCALAAVPARAQPVEPRVPVDRAEFGGRVHLLYTVSSEGESAPASEFLLRRARLWGAARLNDWIDGAVLLDLGQGAASARYAFVRFTLDPSFRITAGQFRRAFDLFELTASSDMLMVERDGRIQGLDTCTGVGGPCSYSRFSEQLHYSALDVGVLVEGRAGSRVEYLASVTNGAGLNQIENNDTKSVAGRVTWAVDGPVVLGFNVHLKDFTNAVTARGEYGTALGADVEVGAFGRRGFHLQTAVMSGDHWRNLDAAGIASRFLTAQTVVSYRLPTAAPGRIEAVEPMARMSWGDPDRERPDDGGLMVTPGLVLHLDGKTKLSANLDVWRPQTGDTAWSLKTAALLFF